MVKWIDATEELPEVKTFTADDIGETIEWQESDPVLIKFAAPRGGHTSYMIGRFENDDPSGETDRRMWVSEEDGWGYGLDEVVAWAPLSELE